MEISGTDRKKMDTCYIQSKRKRISYIKQNKKKRGKLTELVTYCTRTAFVARY